MNRQKKQTQAARTDPPKPTRARPTRKRRRRHNGGYYIQEGFRGIFSHGLTSVAAIIIIAACLLITGSLALIAVNIEYNLSTLMEENEFLAYVDDSLTEDEARALQDDIESIENVASVTFISQKEAKEAYLADIDADDDLYASLPDSVLRHRYSISVTDIELLSETIDEVAAVEGIADVSAALEVANGLVTVRNVLTIVAVGMVVVLLVISFFIISNAIKMASLSRQEEIGIMKMCGATNGFIRMPFVIEGVILGLVSAIIAFGCQWGIYQLLLNALHSATRMQLVSMVPFSLLAPVLAACFAGFGLIVGIFGSIGTIRKYLQV